MKHITELAERLGLVSPDAIEAFSFGVPVNLFFKVVDMTAQAIFIDEREAEEGSSGTSVLASSSLRSDSGCRDWGCRQATLDAMGRYACLYADRLIVPISLSSLLNDEMPARYAFADLYYKVSVLRPLFDAGIAVFAPDIHCFCKSCGKKFNHVCDEYDAASFDTYLARIGQDIRVIYRPPVRDRSWYAELIGPAEYIPHGNLRLQPMGAYAKTPRWAPKRLTRIGHRLGAEMSPRKIREHRIGGTHFGQLARDAVIQQYTGVKYNASYVINSLVEAQFLERIYPRDNTSSNLRELLEQMQHEIPLLADVSLRRILRIRQSDHDSFLLYRNAIQQVIREYIPKGHQLTKKASREICSDIILPQLRKLKVEAAAKRRSAVRRALVSTTSVSAAIAFGLIAGMIRPELERLFQIGGIALAGKIGDLLGAIEKHPAEIRNHNMYFLLKLTT